MTTPLDAAARLEVFFPEGQDASAYVEQARGMGWSLVDCQAGWAVKDGRLCYGIWYRFRPGI